MGSRVAKKITMVNFTITLTLLTTPNPPYQGGISRFR